MNYERFKKVIVSLALMCVFAFSTMVANVVPADAQGYYPRHYYRWEWRYDRDYWGYRRVYRDPWVRYRYWSIYPYGYYPYRYWSPYVYSYPYGYYPYWHHGQYGRIGKLHWWWF